MFSFLAAGEMGFRVTLHGSNPEPLMSALGQKRTSELVQSMSALPPIADVVERDRHVRFVPKADSCIAAIPFDQLICTGKSQQSESDGPWQ
jgi:hypothetical protein